MLKAEPDPATRRDALSVKAPVVVVCFEVIESEGLLAVAQSDACVTLWRLPIGQYASPTL